MVDMVDMVPPPGRPRRFSLRFSSEQQIESCNFIDRNAEQFLEGLLKKSSPFLVEQLASQRVHCGIKMAPQITPREARIARARLEKGESLRTAARGLGRCRKHIDWQGEDLVALMEIEAREQAIRELEQEERHRALEEREN